MHLFPLRNRPGSRAAHLLLAAALAGASPASGQDVILGTGNSCPDGRVKVTCATGCQKAKEAASENIATSEWNKEETDKKWPSDCYFCDGVRGCTDGVWFNNHKTGRKKRGAAPLCVLPTWDSGCDDGGDDDGGVTGGHVDVLFAGDSDIRSWPDEMRLKVSTSSVNVGAGGWTCKKLKKKIKGFLEEYTPLWTVVVCGENDLLGNGKVSKAFKSFSKVVKEITRSGSRALYIGTKPEPSTQKLHSKYRKYDQKIRDYAEKLADGVDEPPLVMVDSYRGLEDLGNPLSLYSSDRLHLSRTGYNYWTEWTSVAAAEAHGGSPCTVWQSGECTQPKIIV